MTIKYATVRFEDKTVLDNFSLTLPDKGIVCLSGPSGCGKTTLLRVLCGLQTLDSGTLEAPTPCAVVFQEDRLLPWRSCEKNIALAAEVSTAEARQWLSRMGLEAEAGSLPESLSGGMRRRVAIARALAAKSRLLLLDEPFQGLDAVVKELLYPLIQEVAMKKPVLLVTHHPEEAEALGARVIRLEGPPLRVL